MTKKIFRSILCATMGILAASLLIITGFLYDYFCGVQEKQLQDELGLAVEATEQLGESYLEKVNGDRYRLTWVDEDGEVLYDTQADAAAMDNHGDREEIREAFENGSGTSSRYSATLTEETLYEAALLADGTVLRISVSRVTVVTLLLGMLYAVVLIVILAFVVSAVLAKRMAKKIVGPLDNLNLEQPLENDVYEELLPLLRRIHGQQGQIQMQMTQLKQKTEEFQQITGNMKEGLVLLDKKGIILSMNPAAQFLFHTNYHCIGQDFLTIDRKYDIRRAIDQAMESGHSETRIKRNGREYQFDISRIESDGVLQGSVLLAFDVTEQANAERNRREFTANVSHELKTPLQAIIGSADLLENGLVKAEDIPRFMGHIQNEASRLLTLIEDILRLSQMDEGDEMPREEVSLSAMTDEVFASLQSIADAKKVQLVLEGDGGTVFGVRRLLYEIVYNLCENAIKYNVEGGKVLVKIEDRGKEVLFTVGDTGIGIPAEHQTRVFERFYRVDKSHSKKSGGTGLGLSIVKHAVQYHHGKISLQSEPGIGTTVTVILKK